MPTANLRPTDSPRSRRPHILLVDDNFETLKLLQRVLQNDYHVTFAQSGDAALELLGRYLFDLVLLDMMMPGLNGLDVLKMMRSDPETANIPVVVLSAMSRGKDVVTALQAGANDYVTKPFDIEVVRMRIHNQVRMKELMDERAATIEYLRDSVDVKDRFLRIATHDLKNPLNNIRMAHYYLRTLVGQKPEAAEALGIIADTVDTMTQLIEDFLDTAAIQSGKPSLNPDIVPVESILWEVFSNFEAAARRKQITLMMGDVTGVVYADPTRLHQIISNLVSNAVKYSPEGRVVTVSAELHNGNVRINVADEGPGIPEAERGNLFEPFGKLSTKPTGGESSSGLGLWIVRELVALHHGKLGVESPADGGSIFWVELPAWQEQAMVA
ncbi:MAG TPA: hybrid sensor histidine kinase/response regulator [Aggregatilineales bacterium]|nr:hybrid sensor histidine kinase/response regulator [Aggregatilineales bacterium]